MVDGRMDYTNVSYLSWYKYHESPEIKIQIGDILYVKTGSTFGKTSYVDKLPMEATINPQILRIVPSINSRYLAYCMSTPYSQALTDCYVVGSTIPTISQESIGKFTFTVPPLAEQEAIAAWLEDKCGDIDAAIAKVDREIELIDELKQSEISRVVTRGLNPNVKLRPSGIDWIGEIPEHWDIAPLKFKCSLKGRIGWNGLKSDEFKDSAYAYLVTGQDFRGADIEWHKCYQIDKWRYDEDPFIQLENGDILITKDGTIGKIAKVSGLDKPACLNSGIFVMKQLGEFFSQQYLYWVLVSPQLLAFNNYVAGQGTTIQHLYQNVFENMPLLVPPLTEQREIADYLDKKCAEIDCLKSKLKKKRDTLVELRQSMISEVVTGKRKVV